MSFPSSRRHGDAIPPRAAGRAARSAGWGVVQRTPHSVCFVDPPHPSLRFPFKSQTPRTHVFAPRRRCARALPEILRPLTTEGAGNAGCPKHPQPGARWGSEVCTPVFTAEAPESPGIPHAMVLQIIRDLAGDRAFLPPSFRRRSRIAARLGSARLHTKLDTSVGVSGPHDFSVRNNAARLARRNQLTNCFALRLHLTRTTPSRPPHPTTNVRDDREPPLLWGGMTKSNHRFLKNGSNVFLQGGLDRNFAKLPDGQIT